MDSRGRSVIDVTSSTGSRARSSRRPPLPWPARAAPRCSASLGCPVGDERGKVPRAPRGRGRRHPRRGSRDRIEVDLALLCPALAADRVRMERVRAGETWADPATLRRERAVEIDPGGRSLSLRARAGPPTRTRVPRARPCRPPHPPDGRCRRESTVRSSRSPSRTKTAGRRPPPARGRGSCRQPGRERCTRQGRAERREGACLDGRARKRASGTPKALTPCRFVSS